MTVQSVACGVESHDYLRRLGLDAGAVTGAPSPAAVTALQGAHVRRVPFETLAVTGDPFGHRQGGEVALALPRLYEKVVQQRRGGYCYELNGLFGWLLRDLGYTADYIAARILRDDGAARPPANHLTNCLTLDGTQYLVDVGLGTPTLREPLPLDGTVVTDDVGVSWRVVGTERPDADGLTQFRRPGEESWTDRYLFETTPRDLDYFAATNDYLSTAPESPFVGSPVVTRATDCGHVKLTATKFLEYRGAEATEHPVVGADEWYERLDEWFDIDYSSPQPTTAPPDDAARQ